MNAGARKMPCALDRSVSAFGILFAIEEERIYQSVSTIIKGNTVNSFFCHLLWADLEWPKLHVVTLEKFLFEPTWFVYEPKRTVYEPSFEIRSTPVFI